MEEKAEIRRPRVREQMPGMNGGNGSNPRKWVGWVLYIIMLGVLCMYFMNREQDGSASKELSYTQFTSYIEHNYVSAVRINDANEAIATVRDDCYMQVFGHAKEVKKEGWLAMGLPDEGTISSLISDESDFAQYMETVNATRKQQGLPAIDVTFVRNNNLWQVVLVNVLPIAIFIFFIIWMNRGAQGAMGSIFSIGRAKAAVLSKDKKGQVTFKDVAGLSGAKQEVQEIVEFLKNPGKFTELGGKIPKGALLVGPPGTGKTLLAKAVAGEADVPFFSMSGSDFVEMFVGVGASRVRDLFRQAKEAAPAIIFIDEIDAVGRARGKSNVVGSNDERESTLNQLLTEMDGFGTNSGVIILAATNRAEILDPALMRAGRFDRQIHVDLPDLQERKEIFAVHLKPLKQGRDLDIDFLAKQTPGFSGADIANVCNEAALIAARNGHKSVGRQDFMDAVDRIVGGLERKNKIMTEDEKRSIAYHEAGHATVSWVLRYANPLVKVTIVPRGMALGAAWYLPEERQLTNLDHLKDEMCATLAGRAAEELFLGQTSTGALNDLEKVNKQAYAMVAYYGMSEKLKNICYYDSTGQASYFNNPYSERTAQLIDEESERLIAEQMERAKSLLRKYEEGHHKMAQLLIEREVITHEDVEAILGPRPWKSRGDELMAENEASKTKTKRASATKTKTNTKTKTKTKTNEKDNLADVALSDGNGHDSPAAPTPTAG